MFLNIATAKNLLFRAVRRGGWGVLGLLVVLNTMHWQRNGTLGLGDVRDSLIALAAYTAVGLLIEYQRMREEASSGKWR
ncbi:MULTISPECIES: hypothetical protein [unclassified Janthinobacterium]|uniref:hypothetical protein n=1 Tax=unclassified Janthinobacterium TaxID=2610881 RepID=UPI00160F2A20|nr:MULTISPECIES: hypothetical protein [unclassified Janthinobacterium]MBB5371054.1 hypothetical protein [Janthinobacterium sp. K2C7]MBB5383860.1 hypothetical protein [Janthinobacterium sp. K2Li3]MBB5389318.1 hypothetical protein [Janthinobacterium sp. K2E3]